MFGHGNRTSDAFSDLETLRTDVSRLANTISSMIGSQSKSTGNSVQSSLGAWRDEVSARASDWSDRGSSLASNAGHRLSDVNTDIGHRIERNPLTAVLVAAGIGVAIGLMSRSR